MIQLFVLLAAILILMNVELKDYCLLGKYFLDFKCLFHPLERLLLANDGFDLRRNSKMEELHYYLQILPATLYFKEEVLVLLPRLCLMDVLNCSHWLLSLDFVTILNELATSDLRLHSTLNALESFHSFLSNLFINY